MRRNDVLEEGINRCLQEMYKRAQPPMNWMGLLNKAKKGEVDRKDDFINHHYLSMEEYSDILNEYLDSYRVINDWPDHAQLVYDYLAKGGTKEVYRPEVIEEDGFKHPGYRDYEKTPKVTELIGKEEANKVLELIENCKNFYKGNTEECQFRMTIMNYSPTFNKEAVKKYYEEKGEPIEIYDRVVDPYTDKWVSVTSKQLKEWKKNLSSFQFDEDDWYTKETKKLIDRYDKKDNSNS